MSELEMRIEAMRQAVSLTREAESSEDVVGRAEAFFAFLIDRV